MRSYETQEKKAWQIIELVKLQNQNQAKPVGKEHEAQTSDQEFRSMATLQCIRCQSMLD